MGIYAHIWNMPERERERLSYDSYFDRNVTLQHGLSGLTWVLVNPLVRFVDFAIHTGSTAIPGLTWRPHMCQNFIEQDLDHFFNLFNILLSPYTQRLIFYFLSSTSKELLQCKTCVYYIRSLKFINLTITVFTVCDTLMAHRSR